MKTLATRCDEPGDSRMKAALARLRALDPDLERLCELRFVERRPVDEVVEVSGRSRRNVDRELRFAMAWLRAELGPAA